MKTLSDWVTAINIEKKRDYNLLFLVENNMRIFKKSDVRHAMNLSDNVLSNFLSKMVELGILESAGNNNSGKYEFSNNLFYTYFWIKSFEKSRKNHIKL